MSEIIDQLEELYPVYKTGSKYICCPKPTGTDTDYLVALENLTEFNECVGLIKEHGFMHDAGEGYDEGEGDQFYSYSKGEGGERINLLLSYRPKFINAHIVATEICKRLNLLRKEDRIMVFQGVLYGQFEHEVQYPWP